MNVAPLPRKQRQQGRTLLEVLIAMAIGLVILIALGVVHLATTTTYQQSTSVNRMNEDATYAFKVLGDSFRMAGYSAPLYMRAPTGGAIVGGTLRIRPTSNFSGTAIRGCDYGFDDISKPFDQLTCLGSSSGASAAMAIRFEGDSYNTVPASDNRPSDCTGSAVETDVPSAIGLGSYALIEARFTANADSGAPSLGCAGNSNNFTLSPLISSVEQMHLRYGVAKDRAPGQVERYAAASDIGANQWEDVVSVRVCLLLRSQNREQSGSAAYLDCDGNVAQSTDGHMHRAVTNVYALRNRIDLPKPQQAPGWDDAGDEDDP